MKPTLLAVVCLFLMLTGRVTATHNMGGELTYKYISGETWLVTLKAYRDCHGTAYNTPYLKVTSACGTDSFTMNQKSVTDITPAMGFCPGNTRCADTIYKYGVEEIVFEYTITLNDTCCNYTLSWTDCCRNTYITGPTNLPLYVEAKLNRCQHNSSPTFDTKPRMLFPVGQVVTISFHASDPESDTLTYEQVDPLLNASTAYTYPGNWSATRPVTFSGFPNTALAYPSGINFDSAGNLMFKPTILNQTLHIAVKVIQWKTINGALTNIGEVTRDIQYIVIPNGGNNAPEIPGYNTVLEFCKGTTSCKTIEIFDADTTDTVSVNITHNITGLTYTQKGTLSNPLIEICYTPDSAATANGKDQFFKITATDGKCSTPGYSEKNYIVRQKPELPDSFSIQKTQQCYDVSISLQNSSSHTAGITASWMLTSPSGLVSYSSNPAFSRKLTDTGWHKLSLTVSKTGYCVSRFYKDSVYISPSNNISVRALPDTTLCFNPSVTMRLSVTGGTPPFTYRWTGGDTTPTKAFTAAPGVNFFGVEVEDSFKCRHSDSARVSFYNPQVSLSGDTLVCLGKPATITATTTNAIKPKFAWAGFTATTSQLVHSPDTNRQYEVTVTDSAGCKVTRQWDVKVYGLTMSFSPTAAACAGDSVILKVKPADGFAPYTVTWPSLSLNGDSIKAPTPGVSVVTDYKYPATVTDARGCSKTDSTTVQVKPLPSVAITTVPVICNTAGIFNLTPYGSPSGGFWLGKGVFIDKLNPAISDTGSIALRYTYTDAVTNCQNSDSSSVFVEMAPVAGFVVDSLKGPVSHTFSFVSNSIKYPLSPVTWDFDDPASGTNNSSNLLNPLHQFTDSGSYKVKLTVSGGVCAPDTEVKIIKVYRLNNVGIKGTPALKALVYPNPATDFITVEGEDLKNIRLLDLQGRYIPAEFIQTAAHQYRLGTKTLVAGVYFVEIMDIYNATAKVKITIY